MSLNVELLFKSLSAIVHQTTCMDIWPLITVMQLCEIRRHVVG